MWDQVIASTKGQARAENVRGKAAMNHVRNLFEWLPGTIMAIVDALQIDTIGYAPAKVGTR
jgi:hypothetical protein